MNTQDLEDCMGCLMIDGLGVHRRYMLTDSVERCECFCETGYAKEEAATEQLVKPIVDGQP